MDRQAKFLTSEEAAARLGVTPMRIRQMISRGQLIAQKFGRAHMILESDVEAAMNRPKVGRPSKAKAEAAKAGKKGGKK